jgi:hypothetical protein
MNRFNSLCAHVQIIVTPYGDKSTQLLCETVIIIIIVIVTIDVIFYVMYYSI